MAAQPTASPKHCNINSLKYLTNPSLQLEKVLTQQQWSTAAKNKLIKLKYNEQKHLKNPGDVNPEYIQQNIERLRQQQNVLYEKAKCYDNVRNEL